MAEELMVSLVLITYNHEQFIQEAIQSVFAQTYAPIEIILSDDCSTDRTYEIMNEAVSSYRGRNKIILNRNKENLGLAGNLNRAFELANGQFIVLQAGDDISVPDRVEKLVRRWQTQDPPVDLVCSYFEEIDVHGRPTGFIKKEVVFVPDISLDPIKWRCGATGACAAYSRKLLETYGPLNRHVYAEDWVYSFRAWIESGIALVEEPLVKHRTHDASAAVVHRTINSVKDRAQRKKLRKRSSENSLGIAEEWLHAWQIGPKRENEHIASKLRQLVKVRELDFRVHGSTRTDAFRLSLLFLMNGGGFVKTAKLLVRHVLRWD